LFLQLNFYSTCDDGYIRDFENESVELCDVQIGHSDEITPDDVYEHGYRKDQVLMINEETNANEHQYVTLFYLLQYCRILFLHYRDVWLCNALTNISAATFTYSEPPIIIAHIRHVSEKK